MMNREEFNKELESIKEVLSNMPQNNKKNKKKYSDYIKENLVKYREIESKIISEFGKRYDDIEKRKGKGGIDFSNKEKKIDECLNELVSFNKWNTPYEKIGMDKIIYEINHYYQDNLEAMNSDIRDAIKCFEKAGVKLSSKDFMFSKYVNQYMDVILSDKKDSASKKLDEVYWKSPNIIHQIAMNFNYLYIKYEKNFNNYYKSLLKNAKSEDNLLSEYNELLESLDEGKFDIVNISDKLISGELNIKDYSDDKLESYMGSIGDNNIDMGSLIKLYDSLYEYKMYKEYQFIIDKVIELYKDKGKFKNSYKNLLKDINKIYGKISKVNKKIKSQEKWFHNSEKEELLELNLNTVMEELKEKDNSLGFEKVNEVISGLNDNVSYYDILKLIVSNYVYFRSIIMENQEELSYEDVVLKQKKLGDFLYSNKLTFLDNIKILDTVNIPQMIGDRYKLLNININQEEIENNFENYMDIIEKIRVIDAIKNSKVNYSELLFQINIKDIIKK